MTGKEQIERDYESSSLSVEALAKQELERIRKKTFELKAEAEKVGKAVESELEEDEAKSGKKKS